MPPKVDPLDESLHLHTRLLGGDPTASARLADIHLSRLIAHLKSKFPSVDDHLVEMAVDDAMMNYLLRPEQYDPTKLSLHGYLRMSARGDLLNHMKKQETNNSASIFPGIVELDAFDLEQHIEDRSADRVEEHVTDRASPVWQHLAELIPEPVDQEIVLLMMDNVRDTGRFAELLNIGHMSNEAQAREVKRNKDRLKKRIQRHLERSEILQDD